MDELPFTPADHDPHLTNAAIFNPTRHNWLRAHKVPSLVINATTVNTGHGWQFTPTWMGESPWAVHEAADVVPRLQWARYHEDVWRVRLGRAVAASACVPGVFAPLQLSAPYEPPIDVRLIDGGVYDNQGTVALLAANCNVLIVSDAAGQLLLEPQPTPGLRGILSATGRAVDTLMERVRQANFGDLSARRMTGLVRGMMFIHMKAGLDADPIRLELFRRGLHPEARDAESLRRPQGSAAGALGASDRPRRLHPDESLALMACGYQMASKGFLRRPRASARALRRRRAGEWPFAGMLKDITSTARQDRLLDALRSGHSVQL